MQESREPLEIERKFLIRYPDLNVLEENSSGKVSITQTYLVPVRKLSRRIRKTERNGEAEYWYTEKERISDMTRIERERKISEAEYEELMKEARPDAATIRKVRYFLPSGSHCFEVDLFPDWNDRAFAEVELKAEGEEFHFPECLTILKEVTADRRYTNQSLALHGFLREEID